VEPALRAVEPALRAVERARVRALRRQNGRVGPVRLQPVIEAVLATQKARRDRSQV
jgi:hypothetical protein